MFLIFDWLESGIWYNPKIMIFIESNIYHNIIYTLSLICLKFNKPCAFCYLTLKIFETSPFILNNMHKNDKDNILQQIKDGYNSINNYFDIKKFKIIGENILTLNRENRALL